MDAAKFDLDVGWYFEDGYWWTKDNLPLDFARKARDFSLRDTDVLTCTFPKTGQTWLLAILAFIKNADKLERGEQFSKRLLHNAIFFDMKFPEGMGPPPAYLMAPKIPGRRVFKSHLPLTYWQSAVDKSPGTKIIQTIRDPKDTLVSMYHFMKVNRLMGWYNGTWDEFFEMVKSDSLPMGGYFRFHAEWYEYNKKRENSLILFYEDMKKDLRREIKRIAEFLGENLSDNVLDLITEETTFKNMAKNREMNPSNADFPFPMFRNNDDHPLRKGEIGDWVNYMNDEQVKFIDEQTKKWLEPVGLNF